MNQLTTDELIMIATEQLKVFIMKIEIISPHINFQAGQIFDVPIITHTQDEAHDLAFGAFMQSQYPSYNVLSCEPIKPNGLFDMLIDPIILKVGFNEGYKVAKKKYQKLKK